MNVTGAVAPKFRAEVIYRDKEHIWRRRRTCGRDKEQENEARLDSRVCVDAHFSSDCGMVDYIVLLIADGINLGPPPKRVR